ncbi:ABC transporter substrate-binding protein [Acuticoccus kandeliae]|uniref:ABC transporter substrate-binding protein n=1 Tax=Acuticoccus kandeliae TaxID=2073160 RepID=UPI000D3E47F5|nr:ABC transporter substrate-binding protein [Acuticoccus kandeliae]
MIGTRNLTSALVATFVALVPAAMVGPAQAADDVAFALNWIISGRNAGYFVALDKGFYADKDLNVTITRGRGSGDTLKRVAIGESDFGLVDSTVVTTGVANDQVPVKMIGMMYSNAAMAAIYPKNTGMTVPKDLEGKTIARAAAGAAANMWPVFLKLNDVDPTTVSEVIATSSTNVPLLLSGQVQAVVDQSSYLGRYQKAADAQGLDLTVFRFSDYGLSLYGDAIVASDETIAEKPDLVKRFLEATLEGNLYAFEHPDEAMEILVKHAEEVEADVAKAELLDTKEIAMTSEVEANGYGYIDPARITEIVELINEPFGMTRKVTPDEVMTDQFLTR